MDFNFFVPWLSFMIPLVYSAGPNNLMCAASGAQVGFSKTLPFIAGVNTSLILMSVLIGFGIGKINEWFPDLSTYVSIAGAIYLLYLAYKMIHAGSKVPENKQTIAPGFKEGFLLNSLNPKGIVGLSIMFNEFVGPHNTLTGQIIILSVSTVLISASAHIVWAAGGTAISSLIKTEKGARIQGYVFGIMLAGVAIWMLFY
jgi:threonine/homoserine/homoserine lactone efflux protein